MKPRLIKLAVGTFMALAMHGAMAQSRVLTVATTTQEHSMWCWAATSKAVITYYGQWFPSQCSIANWALGIDYACGNSTFDWNSDANVGNWMAYDPGPDRTLQEILTEWQLPSTHYYSASTWTNAKWDLDNSRPFIMHYAWNGGGGHYVVGYGYQVSSGTNYIYTMDPGPGEGKTMRTFSSAVKSRTHKWTQTLRMNISPSA